MAVYFEKAQRWRLVSRKLLNWQIRAIVRLCPRNSNGLGIVYQIFSIHPLSELFQFNLTDELSISKNRCPIFLCNRNQWAVTFATLHPDNICDTMQYLTNLIENSQFCNMHEQIVLPGNMISTYISFNQCSFVRSRRSTSEQILYTHHIGMSCVGDFVQIFHTVHIWCDCSQHLEPKMLPWNE